MYSFARCADMEVMDEPFYGVYLSQTGLDHPGKEEIIRSMLPDENDVLEKIYRKSSVNHLFIKNMASHFKVLHKANYSGFKNVFLIRNPQRIITSYSKVIHEPTIQDIGIRRQVKLYRWFSKHGTDPPIVIDSNDVLADPERHLRTLCTILKLPFEQRMLSWNSGPKDYDGVWAPFWYTNVRETTGFVKQSASDDPLSEHLRSLYEKCLQDYHFLYEKSITNPDASKVQSSK
jgi:hypothetical protein